MSHVLVVDDEPGFRDVLSRILVSSGYEVQVAIDAQDALRSIAESRPGIIFCDIHMPGRDGLWLADQVRAISSSIPMVLCTSDDTIPPTETLRNGIIAYVIKPFQRRAILAAAADAAEWYNERTGARVTRTRPLLDEDDRSPEARDTGRAERPRRRVSRSGTRVPPRVLAIAVLIAAVVVGVFVYWTMTRERRVLGHVAAASGVIEVFYASGRPLAQGSGFFVAPDLFVTSHHVVQGGARAVVTRPDGSHTAVAGVEAFDRDSDLAVLKTADPSSDVMQLNTGSLGLGDQVLVYGAPLGLAGTLAKGIVNAAPAPDARRLQISAPLSPGSSGSPVMDPSGRVVGIASEVRVQGQELGFAVPARKLSDLLARAGAPKPLLVTARGTGSDLERWQLIGEVRKLTGAACVPGAPQGAACSTTLLFDAQGRMMQQERNEAGALTRTEYRYADDGSLESERSVDGHGTTQAWEFVAIRPTVLEARSMEGERVLRRRLTYDDNHRLLSDENWVDDVLVSSTRWRYDEEAWPQLLSGISPLAMVADRQVEYDAVGNVVREVAPDGSIVSHRYTFDDRGNWVVREDLRGEDPNTGAVIGRQTRTIEYW